MHKVLITCTRPRGDDYVIDLRAMGIDAVANPALIYQALNSPMPKGTFDAMLITSRHAFNADLPDLPVIAVGAETANLAQENNKTVIQVGDGGVADLDLSPYASILYPCADSPTLIPQNATAWPVYKTIENPEFSIPDDVGTICVFSIKAAEIIIQSNFRHKTVLCLSHDIAKLFDKILLQNLAVAMQPRYDAMISLILNHTEEVKK
jgi:uroporphyrinogen-III synthase